MYGAIDESIATCLKVKHVAMFLDYKIIMWHQSSSVSYVDAWAAVISLLDMYKQAQWHAVPEDM